MVEVNIYTELPTGPSSCMPLSSFNQNLISCKMVLSLQKSTLKACGHAHNPLITVY